MSGTDHTDKARKLGESAAAAYRDQFGASPSDHGPAVVAGWDAVEWPRAWDDLGHAGAAATEYDACLNGWLEGFWGGSVPAEALGD